MGRIYLSPPHMTDVERSLLLGAFDANWVAPVGPDLDAFEREFAARQGVPHAVALSSGSAALHLGLLVAGVQAGDAVIVPTFTFAATANSVRYCNADPVFVDSERATWNADPALIAAAVEECTQRGQRVGAVVTVDLYGQCADHAPIRALCNARGIPLIEDAAEAVGATWAGRPAGAWGDIGVFSFNGNKIMTTGGGGMLTSADPTIVDQVRHLSTQAREPALHYEHKVLGFNYRLSNPLAAIGRGQVQRLSEMIDRRSTIRDRYVAALGELPGVSFNPIDDRGTANHWLTVVVLGDTAACSPTELITALDSVDIEARPAWKPMHLQPLYADALCHGGAVAADIFARGICLPSGSSMTDDDLERVISTAQRVLGA
jgi:dTDP-4-amino-4,6-dideoxygalactose transaminase